MNSVLLAGEGVARAVISRQDALVVWCTASGAGR